MIVVPRPPGNGRRDVDDGLTQTQQTGVKTLVMGVRDPDPADVKLWGQRNIYSIYTGSHILTTCYNFDT